MVASSRLVLVLVLILTFGVTAGSPPVAARTGPAQEVIVALKGGATPNEVLAVAGVSTRVVTARFDHAVRGFAAALPPSAIDRLRRDPRVMAVEADHRIAVAAAPTGIHRIGADAYEPADIDGDGSTVDADIAILDTGVDAGHPDLNVVGGVDCRSGSCVTVDAPTDPHGHGTHIAGTAAARDDGAGVVGVAPGARIASVRVLEDDGTGRMSSLLAALDWLRIEAERIEVANISMTCECTSVTLNDAIRAVIDAGVTLVVAAGNAGTDAGAFSPASHPDVLAVAAMSDYDGAPGRLAGSGCIPDSDDSFASYSNYGAVVDLVAPGSCITSTWPGGGYRRATGTSMAAPHVTGAAALHIATANITPTASRPAEVRRALLDDLSVPSSDDCGYTGSVSVAPMLHLTCVPAPTNSPPTLTVVSPQDGLSTVGSEAVELRASSSDEQDGRLDAEIVWTSSLDGNLGTGSAIDARLSAGEHTIVASVTDSAGANVRISRSVTVTATTSTGGGSGGGGGGGGTGDEPSIPQEPEPEPSPSTDHTPHLAIVAPVPLSRIVAAADVLLVASATDTEDGDIRSGVGWRSDLDGDLGGGGAVTARLSSGSHRITASVTDAAGNLVERTTTVAVAPTEGLDARPITSACPPDRVPDRDFDDVDEANPHRDAIDCIAWWRITEGAGNGGYSPAVAVTRGQMASFLAETIRRSGGSLPKPTRDHFTDDDGSVHEANINQLAEADVIRGVGEGRFAPSQPVTRAQMATFLVRTYERRAAVELPGIQERFDDNDSIHAANVNAVAVSGIAGGITPERYGGTDPVRRDQMASFIARTLDVLVATGATSAPAG